MFSKMNPEGVTQWSLFQAIPDFRWLFATCPGTLGGRLLVACPVCLPPEMNGEALEAKSVTCQLPLDPEAQNQLLDGPGDMSAECMSLLSTVTIRKLH